MTLCQPVQRRTALLIPNSHTMSETRTPCLSNVEAMMMMMVMMMKMMLKSRFQIGIDYIS
jgi:hypothetical protein